MYIWAPYLTTRCNYWNHITLSKPLYIKPNRRLGFLNAERPLSDLGKDSCEGEITLDECTLAVSKMKINKSPGLYGICIEFYKKFWPVVGRLLVDVFNDSYAEGILPDSERTAVMTLIFKKGEEDEIGNFRPISLTNVDYRILAFILSNRLQNIIPSVVNTDQTAYIKGTKYE